MEGRRRGRPRKENTTRGGLGVTGAELGVTGYHPAAYQGIVNDNEPDYFEMAVDQLERALNEIRAEKEMIGQQIDDLHARQQLLAKTLVDTEKKYAALVKLRNETNTAAVEEGVGAGKGGDPGEGQEGF